MKARRKPLAYDGVFSPRRVRRIRSKRPLRPRQFRSFFRLSSLPVANTFSSGGLASAASLALEFQLEIRLTMQITEIYQSIQGESSYAGLPCVFVRTTGCDLRCSWCDSEFTFTGGTRMSLDEIL